MVEITQELIYEVLRKIQGDIGQLKDGVAGFAPRQHSGFATDIHTMQGDINALRADRRCRLWIASTVSKTVSNFGNSQKHKQGLNRTHEISSCTPSRP